MLNLNYKAEIEEYKKCAYNFLNLLIRKFFIQKSDYFDDPYLFIGKQIPKSGVLTIDSTLSYDYKFHGSGCDLIVNNKIKVHFDFAPLGDNRLKTSEWKFFCYLKSKYDQNHPSQDEVYQVFAKLVGDGEILYKNEFGNIVIR